jgi:isocitrate/isopropylmalate dehydrogenase
VTAVSAAQAMKRAIDSAMSDPSSRTPDILGTASTEAMAKAIVERIERNS